METSSNQDKINHALNLMSSLEKLREDEFIRDFMVKVGNETFPVHRNVLASCSGYFKAMFSHKMREVQKGMVDVKGVTPDSMKRCIHYMYTGEAEMSMDNAPALLQACDLMQIDDLNDLCIKYLLENLTPDNCLSTKTLGQTYSNSKLQDAAEQYIINNFAKVTQTRDFFEINQQDLLRYVKVSKLGHERSWKAISIWIKHDVDARKDSLYPLMLSLELKSFSFKYLLDVVYQDPLVGNSETCAALLASTLFSRNIGEHITTANIFALKTLTEKCATTNATLQVINDFMMKNFERILGNPGFMALKKGEILSLLESREAKCSSETVKWDAALKWVKHDQSRRSYFYELMKLIQFETISLDFIQKVIRTEELVSECPNCKDLIIDTLFARASKPTTATSESNQPPGAASALPSPDLANCIAIYNSSWEEVRSFRPSDKRWKSIAKVEEPNIIGLVNAGGRLYLVTQRSLFQLRDDGTWKKIEYMGLSNPQVVSFQGSIYFMHCDTMCCYNLVDNTWTVNLPGNGLFKAAWAATDEFIYAVGESWYSKSAVKRYNPKTNTWSDIAPLRYYQPCVSAAFYHGKVYCSMIHGKFEVYNPDTNSWTEAGRLNMNHIAGSFCVVGGNLYAVTTAITLVRKMTGNPAIQVYDEKSNRWKVVVRFGTNGDIFTCPYND